MRHPSLAAWPVCLRAGVHPAAPRPRCSTLLALSLTSSARVRSRRETCSARRRQEPGKLQPVAAPIVTMSFQALDRVDPDIANLIRNEYRRQSETLELIASENLTSPAILEALGTLLTNNDAEGYPGRRYYGGTGEVIDKIESLAVERAQKLFGADYVNVQPHSGSQANAAGYMAVCQPGDRVMGMDLSAGGHLTHGSPANFSGKLYEIHSHGVSRETETIDYEAMEKLANTARPHMLIGGFSPSSRIVDLAPLRPLPHPLRAPFFVP